jgi:hypothetical protein
MFKIYRMSVVLFAAYFVFLQTHNRKVYLMTLSKGFVLTKYF